MCGPTQAQLLSKPISATSLVDAIADLYPSDVVPPQSAEYRRQLSFCQKRLLRGDSFEVFDHSSQPASNSPPQNQKDTVQTNNSAMSHVNANLQWQPQAFALPRVPSFQVERQSGYDLPTSKTTSFDASFPYVQFNQNSALFQGQAAFNNLLRSTLDTQKIAKGKYHAFGSPLIETAPDEFLESKKVTPRTQWTNEEHEKFLVALDRFGTTKTRIKNSTGRVFVGLGPGVAELIAAAVGTRSVQQIRSHAQKHFLRENRKEHSAFQTSN
ncbi:hypothetical protein GUITHDRAFT_111060 [Guillardia theta CCMP2712]|uniref:Myb-like domain-containing protein n=1 Tax=Guillardia theta (strain CCMP2712) TaxID=905079 RepID=L1J3W1_GUITC|nr:hypothetical protein GUITHDRAFT_111060 [Guillardia theta CCMP2712]EKX43017.1 hypothetical protein GUITHDRAFT_111060 [Guillardia theta CCMP2712]|mmetsp:Transcript_13756/g.47632  ORF Transcript_13756/g.47632 Transcript_13756/m.47632 type:complete len:269 (-) Transcript_13756:88-894(-)|eukprot:XP_005829997.1 hypothetical protein GUITHDRAFT_111060 [Guillardia theta CCMP2712]